MLNALTCKTVTGPFHSQPKSSAFVKNGVSTGQGDPKETYAPNRASSPALNRPGGLSLARYNTENLSPVDAVSHPWKSTETDGDAKVPSERRDTLLPSLASNNSRVFDYKLYTNAIAAVECLEIIADKFPNLSEPSDHAPLMGINVQIVEDRECRYPLSVTTNLP